MRDWQVKRRERTRHLIELGGLVVKAGLVELTDDDRAVIFGMFVEAAAKLRNIDGEQRLLIWRRRGQRAFESLLVVRDEAPVTWSRGASDSKETLP